MGHASGIDEVVRVNKFLLHENDSSRFTSAGVTPCVNSLLDAIMHTTVSSSGRRAAHHGFGDAPPAAAELGSELLGRQVAQ